MKLFSKFDRNALFIIFEGIAFTMVLNLYNPFIQIFAKRMGANDLHIALINSLPPLVAIFVLIPCGFLIERINRKKQTTLFLIFLNSLFYAGIAFVPFIPGQVKVLLYVILIGLMNMPGSLYQTTWQSFFADTFSGSQANKVYSLRSKYGAFFGMLVALLTGWILTNIPKTEGERLVVYQVFYGICFAVTLLQLFFLSKVNRGEPRDGADTRGQPMPLKLGDFREIFANRGFMVYCLCALFFQFTWQMGWPLFFIYNADYAKMNEFQFGLVNVMAGLASFLSYSPWNRLQEKYGSRKMIVFGVLGLALNPLFYTVQMNFFAILLVNMFAGIGGAGFALTLFCGLLETLPESKKTVYISVFNTMINISGFISPLVGIWLYGRMSIYSVMFIIGLLRLLAFSAYVIRWWSGRKGPGLNASDSSLEA